MSKLPRLPQGDKITRTVQKTFGGYQHTASSYDGNLFDMKNLCSDGYPLLKTREKRVVVKNVADFNGALVVDDDLCYVAGTSLYKGERIVGTVDDGEKTFAVLGKRVLIFPDKVYLNLAAKGCYDTTAALTAAVPSPLYGDVYAVGQTAPYLLYRWDGGAWVIYEAEFGSLESSRSGAVTFTAAGSLYGVEAAGNSIYAEGISWEDYFSAGDAVTISGCTVCPENNKTPVIREIDGNTLRFYEGVFTLDQHFRYTVKDSLIVGNYCFTVDGVSRAFALENALSDGAELIFDGTALTLTAAGVTTALAWTEGSSGTELRFIAFDVDTPETNVTIARNVPQMDYLCACDNRLWGCRSDTVYCSKLGDPFNFNVFDGLSTDSYTVETGSPGSFTGCFAFLGYPTFFKEDMIYKIYGAKPADFEAVASSCIGVAANSSKSLAVAGDMLYYLSRIGVMCYGGGVPVNVSAAFGDTRYENGVGGSNGTKYYISMADADGIKQLFVYDTLKGLWHREDALAVTDFWYAEGHLYGASAAGAFMTLDGGLNEVAGTAETELSWWAEFGDFIENTADKKSVIKLQLRLALDPGAVAAVYICYDGGNYQQVGATLTAAQKKSFYLPLIPARCDYFRLKLVGNGGCSLHSLAVQYDAGSGR